MCNPFKHIHHLERFLFLIILGLQILRTLIFPNVIDILILVGLFLIFIACFCDDIF